MFSWFRSDPRARLQKQYEQKLTAAHDAMNKKADRKLHAKLTAEAEDLRLQLEALDAAK